jgi:hypothetical protein
MPAASTPTPFHRGELAWLAGLLTVQFALGLGGIRGYGYMGQDFSEHFGQILGFPGTYSYRLTNPPGLYWLGSLIRRHLSDAHCLEALALLTLALNTAALALMFRLTRDMIQDRWMRGAACTVIALVPFRVIHSVVTAADSFTVPVFVLAAWLALRLVANPGSTRHWLAVAATLTAGMFLKYTLIGLLPPLALVLGTAVWRQRPATGLARPAAWLGFTLALPATVFAAEQSASRRATPADAPRGWLQPGEPSVMRPRDLLWVQTSDRNLLQAPDYFRGEVYDTRKYSYPGLLYLSTFTDVSNFFQGPPPGLPVGWHERLQAPPERGRTAWSQRLQIWVMHLSLPLALAAVVGTLGCGALAVKGLFRGDSALSPTAAVLTLLALGMHAPVMVGLLRLVDPYVPGFWLPRLAMPSVTTFLVLSFVLADTCLARSAAAGGRVARAVPRLTFLYATACAAVYAGFLAP